MSTRLVFVLLDALLYRMRTTVHSFMHSNDIFTHYFSSTTYFYQEIEVKESENLDPCKQWQLI